MNFVDTLYLSLLTITIVSLPPLPTETAMLPHTHMTISDGSSRQRMLWAIPHSLPTTRAEMF